MMMCVVPGAQLSIEEKECCQAMGGECEKAGPVMPASHSCCNTVVQPHNDGLPSAFVSFAVPLSDLAALDISPVVPQIETLNRYGFWLLHTLGPPGRAVDASAPLRI